MSETNRESTGATSALELANVSKCFGDQAVLQAVSFRLSAGELLCVCGANGSGKTTLVKVITGLLPASEGTVQICGVDVAGRVEQGMGLVGAIFHESMVYPELTVLENLRFFARLYGVADSEAHIEELLEQADLSSRRYDAAGVLSRGMRQRLAIARAFVHRPRIVLADEPFTGLDSRASENLITILRSFKRAGGAAVITAHEFSVAEEWCGRRAVLEGGKLVFAREASEPSLGESGRSNAPTAGVEPAEKRVSSRLFGGIGAIIAKDFLCELRARQLVPTMIIMGVLIAWIFRIATEASISEAPVTAGTVLVAAILFSAILASERSFAVEQQNNCISALVLGTADVGNIYISKVLVNTAMLCILELVFVPAVCVFFGVKTAGRLGGLVTVLLLYNIGVSSVGTLFGCAVQATKKANRLLSILVMAVVCPLIVPAIFAFFSLFAVIGGEVGGTGALALVGDFKTAVGFMTAFDAIFVTAGWLLFGFVVRE